jgi:P4 family phage/plasmid primase-like protien
MNKQIKVHLDKDKFLFKKLSPLQISRLLIEHSCLKYLKLYPKCDSYFIYDEQVGIYRDLQSTEVQMLIAKVLSLLEVDEYETSNYIAKVFAQLKFGDNSFFGTPSFTKNVILFENGVLNVPTLKFFEHSPEIFSITRLPFCYDPQAQCPLFLKFLHEFCDGHPDRVEWIKGWLYALITNRLHNQVFIVLRGRAATGKSTMAHIATALVGKEATITSSLRSLNSDAFEIINLQGKKLISISDSEEYHGDLSVLKQIVGGDPLKGRQKYIQGSFEVQPEGMVLIVGNHPLRTRDTGNAILRRMRVFLAERVFHTREDLIKFDGTRWIGPLAEELPGIFNSIISFPPEEADLYLTQMNDKVPSLSLSIKESAEEINPLIKWVRDDIVLGEGAYIGFKVDEGPKAILEGSRRMALYPAYRLWCKKHDKTPLNHINFTSSLMETLQGEGIEAEKFRRTEGYFIKGICLKQNVFDRDNIYGAPLQLESTQVPRLESGTGSSERPPATTLPETYRPPKLNCLHKRLDQKLYESYMDLLKKTDLKDFLNKVARNMDTGLANSLTDMYVQNCKVVSKDFRSKALEVILKGIVQITKFGGIPFKYKPLGVSPRIIPQAYGSTINSTKRLVREKCYELLGEAALDKGYILVDLDIVSCYTSILLGLYSDHLGTLQHAIETKGLWKYIQEEFLKNGKGEVFNKPAVKICVYSSFFMGGNRAMINGILESFRKDLGLTEREFKDSTYYEDCHTIARNVTQEMMNSSVIMDFKAISEWIHKAYLNEYLIGPTGHSYLVTDETFKTAYPNFLQSFEFALLAQTTLETIEKYPKVQVLGHYHDGSVIALPLEAKDEILEFMLQKISYIGSDLGLRYKQKLEIKRTFP